MKTKNKILGLMLCFAVGLSTFAVFRLNKITAKAYVGESGALTEEQLYNQTNTYNVSAACFNDSGEFINTVDQNSERDDINQHNISYDLSQRQANVQVKARPQITVLTPGLNSGASAWSNNYSENNNKNVSFCYDEDSLISKISENAGDAKIYWAKMSDYNAFKLHDITAQKGVYTATDDNAVNNITDAAKHIIVVFDAEWNVNHDEKNKLLSSAGSNNNVYYQFNYMLSKIIYDVKQLNGGVLPKVNLIGHSRGGLTNLQYALDHPDLVSGLISIGTPYFGSTSATVARAFRLTGESDGLDDILNQDVYYGYNVRWNSNYDALYKNIKTYTISSYHTISNLIEVIDNDYSGVISNGQKAALKAALVYVNGAKVISPAWGDNIISAGFRKRFLRAIKDTVPANTATAIANMILGEIKYDYHPLFVSLENDLCVDLPSQQGKCDSPLRDDVESYKGFTDYTRVYASFDDSINYTKVSKETLPVGHNLEARDSKIIEKVLDMIGYAEGVQPSFRVADIDETTVKILSWDKVNEDGTVTIPNLIDGKTVAELAPCALNESDNITKITLPASVKKIDAYAFSGLKNLQEIAFNGESQLESIGYGAFSGCTALQKFNSTADGQLNLPSTVNFVDCFAFYKTAFGTATLSPALTYVGEGAFANITTLTNISISGCADYFSQGGVLYNSQGWLAQYPLGKTDAFFAIPETVSGTSIRFVSPYAFFNETDLTSVNLGNLVTVSDLAFANCTSLTSLSGGENISYVAPFAFGGTGVFDETEQFNTVGKVLVKYNGTATTLNESDFPNGIERIASYAFSDNDTLQEVNLPAYVHYFDDNAFDSCDNLTKVRFLNAAFPTINDCPFVGNSENFKIYCQKSLIDGLGEADKWSNYSEILQPVTTKARFIDLNRDVDFYYGEIPNIPTDTIQGYYNKGWKRYNETAQTSYGDYLAPTVWTETIENVSFKADLIALKSFSFIFYNFDRNSDNKDKQINEEYVVGTINVNTGDTLELFNKYYVLNGTQYDFTGAVKMNKVPYGSALYDAEVSGVTVATFKNWVFNDGVEFSKEKWEHIQNNANADTFYLYANWIKKEFTLSIVDDVKSELTTRKMTYFDSYDLGQPTCQGYRFARWVDENGAQVVTVRSLFRDMTVRAIYNELFTVTLASNNYTSYNKQYEGIAGESIKLPTFEYGNYRVYKWGQYDVGANYVISGNITLMAVWKGKTYSITYANMTFNGRTAVTTWNGNTGVRAPSEYEYGVGLDLSKVGAYYQADSAYSPQLIFMGWYSEKEFYRGASISTTVTGTVTIYAKWRYDYDNPSRSATYTITDDGPFNQGSRYDTVSIGLNSGIYQQLKNLGIKYLTINFKIRLWEVYDGYQEIYVYGGSGSGNLLWSKTDIEHGGSGKSTTSAVYTYHITIDINKLSNVDTLYIRYSAHGAGKDDWQTNTMYCELSYVVTTNDIYGSGVPAFYWSYQDPFK